jgi:hypothetical protein
VAPSGAASAGRRAPARLLLSRTSRRAVNRPANARWGRGRPPDVVYVGSGLAADYPGIDVKGNMQGDEATRHAAKAMILTSNASDPDALSPRMHVNRMIAASESLGQDLTCLNWLTRH